MNQIETVLTAVIHFHTTSCCERLKVDIIFSIKMKISLVTIEKKQPDIRYIPSFGSLVGTLVVELKTIVYGPLRG
jgi:hypothetical protein